VFARWLRPSEGALRTEVFAKLYLCTIDRSVHERTTSCETGGCESLPSCALDQLSAARAVVGGMVGLSES
jgi:hypothetical protein